MVLIEEIDRLQVDLWHARAVEPDRQPATPVPAADPAPERTATVAETVAARVAEHVATPATSPPQVTTQGSALRDRLTRRAGAARPSDSVLVVVVVRPLVGDLGGARVELVCRDDALLEQDVLQRVEPVLVVAAAVRRPHPRARLAISAIRRARKSSKSIAPASWSATATPNARLSHGASKTSSPFRRGSAAARPHPRLPSSAERDVTRRPRQAGAAARSRPCCRA